MTLNLFQATDEREELAPGAVVLRGFARGDDTALIAALHAIEREAPFRHMITPGGFRMSVAMTNCGAFGWVTDGSGYRYAAADPQTGKPWPRLPEAFMTLAQAAAARAGFVNFTPDSCLVNCYLPGARLSLHQDRDERDFAQPIVSVSLGIPATFQFGGIRRNEKPRRVPLAHGDVVVWGGPARLHHHGVLPLRENVHPLLGARRINLTFRKAR